MRAPLLNSAAVLCFAVPIAAQGIVTPTGDIDPFMPGVQSLAIFEGSGREDNLFGRDPRLPPPMHTGETRWEQVDGEFTGAAYEGRVLTSITFRRDGVRKADDHVAYPRVIHLHLRVGVGTFNDFTGRFDTSVPNGNWALNPGRLSKLWPVSVVGSYAVPKAFNLPDLRTLQAGSPQPWIVPIPFDRPYMMPRNPDPLEDSFVWSAQVTGVVSGCYPLDQHTAVMTRNFSADLGIGCVVDNNNTPMRLRIVGDMDPTVPNYCLNFDLDNAPADEWVNLVVGMQQQNLPIPGLCTNLYPVPLTSFNGIGKTNQFGFWSWKILTPWLDAYEDQRIVFQAVTLDANNRYPIKLAASNGIEHLICAATPKVKSLFSHLKDATDATVRFGEGVVTLFGVDE